jgi:hypothetical protein
MQPSNTVSNLQQASSASTTSEINGMLSTESATSDDKHGTMSVSSSGIAVELLGVILGIIGGGLVLCGVVALVLFCIFRRRRNPAVAAFSIPNYDPNGGSLNSVNSTYGRVTIEAYGESTLPQSLEAAAASGDVGSSADTTLFSARE